MNTRAPSANEALATSSRPPGYECGRRSIHFQSSERDSIDTRRTKAICRHPGNAGGPARQKRRRQRNNCCLLTVLRHAAEDDFNLTWIARYVQRVNDVAEREVLWGLAYEGHRGFGFCAGAADYVIDERSFLPDAYHQARASCCTATHIEGDEILGAFYLIATGLPRNL